MKPSIEKQLADLNQEISKQQCILRYHKQIINTKVHSFLKYKRPILFLFIGTSLMLYFKNHNKKSKIKPNSSASLIKNKWLISPGIWLLVAKKLFELMLYYQHRLKQKEKL